MEQDEILALTAEQTGLPRHKTAEVMMVAAEEFIKAVEPGDEQSASAAAQGLGGEDAVYEPQTSERPASDTAQAALDKADEVFKIHEDPVTSRQMYSERSGLIA